MGGDAWMVGCMDGGGACIVGDACMVRVFALWVVGGFIGELIDLNFILNEKVDLE